MIDSASESAAQCLADTLRRDRGRILAALLARVDQFALAEDALQEAAASALVHWARSGLPDRPEAWLIRVAFRKAIDSLRRGARDKSAMETMAILARDEAEEPELIADDRLRLIFTCCNPVLSQKSQVALTLRSICGLSTGEIASVFLDREAAMGQRISRAKAQISDEGVRFLAPDAQDWPARLDAVLAVIYLIFTVGHGAVDPDTRNMCSEALFLGHLLEQLHSGTPEVEGLLSLMLLTYGRQNARVLSGISQPTGDQDRTLWDAEMLEQGLAILTRTMERNRPGPYQLKAAIAACHLAPDGPDWPQILTLYQTLLTYEPTDVVELNFAVALAENGDLPKALRVLAKLAKPLERYQPYHAARGEILYRAGYHKEADTAYGRAIALTETASDATFLRQRRAAALQARLRVENRSEADGIMRST